MRFTIKQLVTIGALSSGALVLGACSDQNHRARAIQPAATGGSGMAGTTAVPPANAPHVSETVIHEEHVSTVAGNEPNWITTDPNSGTGGSGKMGMKKKDGGMMMAADGGTGGSGDDNLGTGGSGFDGLGSDLSTDQGVRRDADHGTTTDNGTSRDVSGGTSPTPAQ